MRMNESSGRHLKLAVLVSGQANLKRSTTTRAATFQNDVLQQSPAESWLHLKHGWRETRLFACTDQPLTDDPAGLKILSRHWIFNSSSQFSRLLECLQRVEAVHPHEHHAFLRIRPDFLVLQPLRQPVALDTFYGKFAYYPRDLGHALRRDQVSCGACDLHCECLQRKYGQVLYAFRSPSCRHPVVTDQVFLFGQRVLPKLLRALRNFSNPTYGHPARTPTSARHCISAGRMLEIGFSRLLEDESIPVRPLSFRGVLERSLLRTTPGWGSLACMFAWPQASAPRCSEDCGNASTWMHKHGLEEVPTLRPAGKNGCNTVSRNWYPSWDQG